MDHEIKDKLVSALAQKPDVLVDFLSADTAMRNKELEEKSERAKIFAERAKDINQMRKRWSGWLLGCIVGIVIFDAIFIILLGRGVVVFGDQKIVFSFIIESLVKIAGLAIIVVKFLFDKDLDRDPVGH